MLKKTPTERISAAEALAHPYFSQGSDEEEEADTVGELKKVYPNCESPILMSGNAARKQMEKEKMTKKDSCVDFRMGKENVFTGKV
jgi:serine/threonine protein kinase